MTRAQLALRRVEARLLDRLDGLEHELTTAPVDSVLWSRYTEAAQALAAIARETTPGAHGELLTTKDLAERLNVSPRTIRRRRKAGQLEAVQLGQRGRAALRWAAS